jgi:hypothetical protein
MTPTTPSSVPSSITKLDGITGQPYPTYTLPNPIQSYVFSVVAHVSIVPSSGDNTNAYEAVIGIDTIAGTQKFSVSLPRQATMLLTFTTAGDPNSGPFLLLPGNNNRDMGSFASQCGPR